MENTLSPLHTLKVFQDTSDLLPRIHTALFDLFKSQVIEAKDFSIGCDQIVAYVKILSGHELIIKAPKKNFEDKNDPDFYPMHRPCSQAWLLKLFEKNEVLGPKLIYLDPQDRFFIETYTPEEDYNAHDKSEKDKERVYNELGIAVRKMHEIKSKKFGHMILDRENEGRFNNWLEMFDGHCNDVEECYKLKRIDNEIKEKINTIFEEHKDYLRSFNDPRILHADLSPDNIRVRKTDDNWHLSGIIDFADTIAGDPLYDLGALLSKVGDWEIISYIEKGYLEGQRFNLAQKKLIQFYAIYYCSWMLLISEDEELTSKRTRNLHNILDLKSP